MNIGDVVKWKYNGVVDHNKIGIVVSDYHDRGTSSTVVMKNVYWMDKMWIRSIKVEFLEAFSGT